MCGSCEEGCRVRRLENLNSNLRHETWLYSTDAHREEPSESSADGEADEEEDDEESDESGGAPTYKKRYMKQSAA